MILLTALVSVALNAQATETPYPEPGRGGARYEVPTEDEDLKPFASYEIKDIRTRERRGGVEIRYELPIELTGVVNEVRLQSTNKTTNGTFTNFKGPNGEANCDAKSCNVRYKNVNVDLDAVKSTLLGQGITGLDLERHLKLSAQFSGDPAGIIHFDQSKLK